MKLHYIYLPKYGIFEEAELHFTNSYNITFDRRLRKLTCTPNDSSIDDDFFSITNKGTSRVVETVSALIGNNGSGKTSVAQFFHDVSIDKSIEHLIVWSTIENGKIILFCQYHLVPCYFDNKDQLNEFENQIQATPHHKAKIARHCYKKEPDGKYKLNRLHKFYSILTNQVLHLETKLPFEAPNIQDISGNVSVHKFEVIYCTNNYTVFHKMANINNFIDLSTSCLMANDTEKYLNSLLVSRANYRQVENHDRMELLRMAALLNKFPKNNMQFTSGLSLPKPKGVIITLNLSEVEQLEERLLNMIESEKYSDWPSLVKQLKALFDPCLANISSMCFADLMLLAFLGNWISNNARFCMSHDALYQKFAGVISRATNSPNITDLENVHRKLFGLLYDATRMHDFKANSGELTHFPDESRFTAAATLYKQLIMMQNQDKHNPSRSMYLDLTKTEEYSMFRSFIDLYFQSFSITHYANFEWHPRISAGEYAQFSIFSRLFSIVDKQTSSRPSRDLILFLDEIEITIHPELQRCLVKNTIHFLETFFPKHKVHVFFASHSPVLLSDIPSENVCYLQRKHTGKMKVEVTYHEHPSDTFAANIHTLYNHSFFMKNLIGAFAQNKIKGIIDKIQVLTDTENDQIFDDLEKQISLIGEPFVQQQLMLFFQSKCSKRHKRILLNRQLTDLDVQRESTRRALEEEHD